MSTYEVESIYTTGLYDSGPAVYAQTHLEVKLNERAQKGWDPFQILVERDELNGGTITGYEVVWVKRT